MALKNEGIAKANPNVVVNDSYINALYKEAQGRDATAAELKKFSGYKVKDAANVILGAKISPFFTATPPATQNPNDIINRDQQKDFFTKQQDLNVQVRERIGETFDFFGFDPKEFFAAAPKPPSLAELYTEFRQENGVTQLETDLSNLKVEEQAIRDRMKQRKEYEAGKPVALGVISGKQTEIEKQAADELDQNMRAQSLVTDQLNTKYTMVNTLMNLTQTDYQNAVQAYDSQFAKAMDMFDLFRTTRKDIFDENMALQDSARANLQIIFNGIEGGTLKFSDLPEDARVAIGKMEIQAGLPVGITGRLKSSKPDSQIVSSTTRQESNGDKYADIIMQKPDGSIYVEKVYLGKERLPSSGGGGNDELSNTEMLRLYNDTLNSAGNYVVTSRNPGNDEEITREDLINILVQDYPWRSRGDIASDVYAAYPDDYDSQTGRQVSAAIQPRRISITGRPFGNVG